MTPPDSADPLLILAMILMVGTSLGWLAQRVRLPGVSGQILAGFVLGHSGLVLFQADSVARLEPLTHFALALIGVTVGAHLNFRRLRNAVRRLVLLLLAEALITPALVVGAVLLGGASGTLALLLGTLAISTAPATIVALVRETRARGVFVKTLIAAVALNNVACIVLFEVARTEARLGLLSGAGPGGGSSATVSTVVLESLTGLGLASLIGASAAVLAHILTLRVVRPERLASISAISILLAFGLASFSGASPLLACLVLGAFQTNLNPARDRLVDSVFANFEPAILCIFFTLAGVHLSLVGAGEAGLLAAFFVIARLTGKVLSSQIAMRLAGATDRVRENLGLALVPQAGVAVGLVILIQGDPAFGPIADQFVAVVLIAVTVNEVLGPILTRRALDRSGEAGRDRPRLVDFLQEESIVTNLEAETLEEAIEQLTDVLLSSHQLPGVDRGALLSSILEREARVSTCIGDGLAVPHGELPEGLPMVGVMGISRRGLPFETPDGQPVHCITLLATPHGERDRHLEVLGALARTLGGNLAIQQQLFNAKSAAHAYEVLHGEETEDFNYFLESEESSGGRRNE